MGKKSKRNRYYNNREIDEEIEYDDFYDDVERYTGKSRGASKGRIVVGKIICILQLVVSFFFLYILAKLNILPSRIFVLISIIILLLWLIIFLTQRKGRNVSQAAGMIVAMFVSVIMAVGLVYLTKTAQVINDITTGVTYDISNYNIAVRNDDPAQTIADTRNYTFAVQKPIQGGSIDTVLSRFEQDLGTGISTVTIDSVIEEANMLIKGEVDAIIYDDAFTSTIIEQLPEFESKIKVLDRVSAKTEVKVDSVDVDINNHTFLVFISGNDSDGAVSMTGRSDVNIVAGINAATKEVLLITIPRDYYVEFPGITAGNSRDKLTHAGIYGMNTLIDTVENLIGRDINYYVRVNFSSMIEIIDAMGGINVEIEKDFISHGGIEFKKGWQVLDGDKALHYVRERYAFEDGDFARGRHQIQVIQAMLNKLMSVNTLTNYNALANAVTRFAATNIPAQDITDLIKLQLEEMPQWHIVTYQYLGDVMMQPCQSASGSLLSVDMPYKESIENGNYLLNQLFNGEVVSEELQLVDNGQLTYVADPR